MTDLLTTLRTKYPHHKIKYHPPSNCKVCHGTGEYTNKRNETTLCICTCVGFPNIAGLFQCSLQKMKKELPDV